MPLKTSLASFAAALVMIAAAPSASTAQERWWCDQARLDAEFAVCDSTELTALDAELQALYDEARQYGLGRGQVAWLRRRNACGYSFDCLRNRYSIRIGVLRDRLYGRLGFGGR